MKRLITLGTLFLSTGLWAGSFCDSLVFKGSYIELKTDYVSHVKNYCDNVIIDRTGKCHLFNLETGEVREQYVNGIIEMCRNSEETVSIDNSASSDDNWFMQMLLSYSSVPTHFRR